MASLLLLSVCFYNTCMKCQYAGGGWIKLVYIIWWEGSGVMGDGFFKNKIKKKKKRSGDKRLILITFNLTENISKKCCNSRGKCNKNDVFIAQLD